MSVSPDDLRRIADLAALELGDEELDDLTRQLSDILDYVSALGDPTDGKEVRAVGPEHAPCRDDEPADGSIGIETLGPDVRDGFFAVPPPPGLGTAGG